MMCRIGVETVSIIAAVEADSRSPALGIELPETGRFRALRLTTKALFMSSQRHVPGLAMFATGCATLLTGAAAGALRVRRVCMIIDSPLHQNGHDTSWLMLQARYHQQHQRQLQLQQENLRLANE